MQNYAIRRKIRGEELVLVYCVPFQDESQIPKISTATIKGRRLGSARPPSQSSDTLTESEDRLVRVQKFKKAVWSEDLIGSAVSPIEGTSEKDVEPGFPCPTFAKMCTSG